MVDESDVSDLHYFSQRVYKINIAVCDDEEFFRSSVRNSINAYANKHSPEFFVDEYSNGEDLLRSSGNYDIILLDYKMGGMDGLETARIIREKNINCTIIFMTNFPYFVYESFEVSTYRFFTKPLDEAKLHKAFDDYFETYENDYPLLLKIGRDNVCIQIQDIVFLEADNKKCYINLVDKRYHCAKTMTAVASLLPKNSFYKVHRSFTINFNYVMSYDYQHIRFINEAYAHIGRKYIKSFREAYRAFSKEC
jgi:DNA-binding LytR/AlgR family response regulator